MEFLLMTQPWNFHNIIITAFSFFLDTLFKIFWDNCSCNEDHVCLLFTCKPGGDPSYYHHVEVRLETGFSRDIINWINKHLGVWLQPALQRARPTLLFEIYCFYENLSNKASHDRWKTSLVIISRKVWYISWTKMGHCLDWIITNHFSARN